MTSIAQYHQIISQFVNNQDLPIDKFYLYSPVGDECNTSASEFFILPNKHLYRATIRPGIKKNYLYIDSSYDLTHYKDNNFSEYRLEEIVNAINNPQQFNSSFFDFYHIETSFKEIVEKELQIVQIKLEKQLLSQKIVHSHPSDVVNKI